MNRNTCVLSDKDVLDTTQDDTDAATWEAEPQEQFRNAVVSWWAGCAHVRLPQDQTRPLWVVDAIADIAELLALPEGWDSYNALPICTDTVEWASNLILGIAECDVPRPVVVPTAKGGVQLEWHGQKEIELEICPDGTISFLCEEREANFDNLSQAIAQIKQEFLHTHN